MPKWGTRESKMTKYHDTEYILLGSRSPRQTLQYSKGRYACHTASPLLNLPTEEPYPVLTVAYEINKTAVVTENIHSRKIYKVPSTRLADSKIRKKNSYLYCCVWPDVPPVCPASADLMRPCILNGGVQRVHGTTHTHTLVHSLLSDSTIW